MFMAFNRPPDLSGTSSIDDEDEIAAAGGPRATEYEYPKVKCNRYNDSSKKAGPFFIFIFPKMV